MLCRVLKPEWFLTNSGAVPEGSIQPTAQQLNFSLIFSQGSSNNMRKNKSQKQSFDLEKDKRPNTADEADLDDKERSFYLSQIRHAEEQLERWDGLFLGN